MNIEHVAIWVKDLEKSKLFYETYFNAQSGELYHNKKKDFQSYFLSFKSGSRLELMNKPNLEESTQELFGYAHIAFSVGSKEEVDRLTDRLVSDGYQLNNGPRTTGDGYYESDIEDPEGNLIEITI